MTARTLGYHPLTDDWRPSPWDCTDPGRVTIAEARNILTTHGPDKPSCGQECAIYRSARKALARLVDAPTVRTSVYTRPPFRGATGAGKSAGLWPILAAAK
ncbi:hypothetical protein [Nocardia sp. NPDC003963]